MCVAFRKVQRIRFQLMKSGKARPVVHTKPPMVSRSFHVVMPKELLLQMFLDEFCGPCCLEG